MMDALAEALGLDPVELRLRNVTDVSQTRGVPYTSTGFARCLREGAQAFGWKEARLRPRGTGRLQRGVGMAGAMWGYPGQPTASAVVRLFGDGNAGLTLGASDLGCGTKTVMAMVLAEELGIPVERIAVEHADTGTPRTRRRAAAARPCWSTPRPCARRRRTSGARCWRSRPRS